MKINLPSINELDKKHFARTYFESRKLPKSFKDTVYFAEDFKKWAEMARLPSPWHNARRAGRVTTENFDPPTLLN